jgi:hypothetical protein
VWSTGFGFPVLAGDHVILVEDKVRDIPYQSFFLKDVIYKEKNIHPWRMEHH